MSWEVKSTGNMTLSILDDDFQVLKVDMLHAGTMKAGTNGDILARTENDLKVIAGFADNQYGCTEVKLPHPEEGISPLPWSLKYDEEKRRMVVMSGKRVIADRKFPPSTSFQRINAIIGIIEKGLSIINK